MVKIPGVSIRKGLWRRPKRCAWCGREFRNGFRVVFSNGSWTYACSFRCAMKLAITHFMGETLDEEGLILSKVCEVLRREDLEVRASHGMVRTVDIDPIEVIFGFEGRGGVLWLDYLDRSNYFLAQRIIDEIYFLMWLSDRKLKVILDMRHTPREDVGLYARLADELRRKGVEVS